MSRKQLDPIPPGEILQSDYELRLARRTTWKRIEARVRTRVA